jgi:tripartite-type tricarboxylate transporter receptor subunit TctC
MLNKKTLATAAALALTVNVSAHAEDSFPTGPLTLVVGFAAGGSTDIQARVLANVLAENLDQPVNVVNQPGAGGAVSLTRLMRNQDEGHTFVYAGTNGTLTFAPHAHDTDFTLDDFRYVASITTVQHAIVTGQDRPFGDSWEELVEYARENPGTSYATQHALDRLVIEYIMEQEGLDLRIVPTSGGGGMAPLILSGDVDFAYSGGTHSGYAETGEMPVLLSMDSERLFAYPDAPSVMEAGYDIDTSDFRVVVVPKNTPDSNVERLAEALEVATQDARFIEITEERILMPVHFRGEEEATEMLYAQSENYRELLERMGGVPEDE